MGLFDFLAGTKHITCPECGTPDAVKKGGEIRCKNNSCSNFDADWALKGKLGRVPKRTTIPTRGNFQPVNSVAIRYRNFAGQERTFHMERDSIQRKGKFISGQATPTGRRIALSRDRILNLAELDSQLPAHVTGPQPSGRERQVLGYHLKHHTTSPLFEKVRAKYPDYRVTEK
jgi:hypothetical protein